MKKIKFMLIVLLAISLCELQLVAQSTPSTTPLCFTAKGGQVDVRFVIINSHQIQYSTNDSTWSDYTSNDTIHLNADGKVYFRETRDMTSQTSIPPFGTGNTDGSSRFYLSSDDGGTVEASGNIMSLYGPNCPNLTLPANAFAAIFRRCSLLTTAPELPATDLGRSCYNNMFLNCISLTAAPALPATTLAERCYFYMFQGCTSLTTAPALPANTLDIYCYCSMFQGCTSLTTPPNLPATTMKEWCYGNMFYGCTSLTTPPELPANTLDISCYRSMFQGCTSLTTLPALPATRLKPLCYSEMFKGCSSLIVNTTAPGVEWKMAIDLSEPDALTDMFSNTSGSMHGTPSANTSYYIGSGIEIADNNVNYSIRVDSMGIVNIDKAMFGEGSLTDADFDIAYAQNADATNVTDSLNYRHKVNVPDTLNDGKYAYIINAIKATAFDSNELTANVRVNIPIDSVEGQAENEHVIISMNGATSKIHWNGNNYFRSKAYKLYLDDDDILSLTKLPFGEEPMEILCQGASEEETEIDGAKVYKRSVGERVTCDKPDGITEDPSSDIQHLIINLNEDEVRITTIPNDAIRVANDAEYTGTLAGHLKYCGELKFQMDVTTETRKYPECDFADNIPLGDRTMVKAEMKLDNKEYYYFALPFDCNISKIAVVDKDNNPIRRGYSIDAAVNSDDMDAHHYVILEWIESKYVSGTTNGYTALNQEATMLNANKGYVIVVVESYNSWKAKPDTVLAATATFTAKDSYREIVSQTDNVSIPTTNSDTTLENPYNGWNLVGNPFFSTVQGSQYSYQFTKKIIHDTGSSAEVLDYTTEIPALSAEIKPFEAVFIRQNDVSGQGTLVVSGALAPKQQVMGAPAILPEYITLTLNENSKMIDRTTIINNVNAQDAYILDEDLLKAHLNSNEIYTINSGIDISFNKMDIVSERKVIPLGIKTLEAGNYTIALSEPLSSYVGSVVLHDKKLNTYYDLTEGESETLSLNKGKTNNRLELIVTGSNVISGVSEVDEESDIEVYVNGNVATISGIEESAIVTICDATGKILYSAEATADRIDYQFPVRGVYMITVRGERVTTTKMVY